MSQLTEEQLTYLDEALAELDFGSITITVHNGVVTQIDRTEKKRFKQQAKQQLSLERK